ncbi:MAG: cob(I)yrinic acid a,c-diamide adenosyltransferase [Amphiplicatus sp.]
MANRLTRIVTRGGDKGETSLGDGTRIPKTDARIALMGEADELNSSIGVVLAHHPGADISEILVSVQHDLFDLGGALCLPGAPLLSEGHVARLDEAAARLNAGLAPLKEFALPGGAPLPAFLHVARALCRRVERSFAAYLDRHPTEGMALPYLNRLSDLLFIAARFEAKRLGVPETLWRKARSLAEK